jgi:hypothetical protein
MSWCSKHGLRWVLPPALLSVALPARAQPVRERQIWAVAAGSKPAFCGAGLGLSWRNADRLRLASAVALGALGDAHVGARADLAIHFMLDPVKRMGAAVYGGGGLSLAVARGHATPYLLLVFGVEHAPGGGGGTFLEVGVGGGVRVAGGYRWRKHDAPVP